MRVWLRQIEVVKKQIGHRRVVVLAGVNDEGLEAGGTLLHRGHDRRHLHEVRPRTDDVDDFQHFFVGAALRGRPSVPTALSSTQGRPRSAAPTKRDYSLIIRARLSRRTSP